MQSEQPPNSKLCTSRWTMTLLKSSNKPILSKCTSVTYNNSRSFRFNNLIISFNSNNINNKPNNSSSSNSNNIKRTLNLTIRPSLRSLCMTCSWTIILTLPSLNNKMRPNSLLRRHRYRMRSLSNRVMVCKA
jgi:hypothetical protein